MAAVLTVLRYVNLRDARRRPRRVLLTLVGVAGSVGLIVSMMAIQATLQRTVERTTGLPAAAGLAVSAAGTGTLADRRTVAAIRRVPQTGTVVPVVRQVARVGRGASSRRVVVLGLPARGFALLSDSLRRRVSGVTLSGPLAGALGGARVGNGVVLDTPRGRATVRVDDVLGRHVGASFNGGVFVLAPLAVAQRLFDRAGRVDVIYVYPGVGASTERLRGALARALGPGVTVERPQVQQAAFRRTFDAIAQTVRIVELIGALVGVFLVFNTVAMSVAERRRLVAVAELAGAGPGTLAVALVLEAALIGALGGAAGVGLGSLVARVGIGRVGDAYAGVLPVTEVGAVVLSGAQAVAGVGIGVAVAACGAALAARRILAVAPVRGARPAPAYAAAWLRGSSWTAAAGATAIAVAAVLAARVSRGLETGWTAALLVVSLAGVALALPVLVRGASAVVGGAGLRRLGVAGRLAAGGLLRAPGRTVVTVAALTAALAVMVAAGTGTRSFEREAARVVGNWNAAALYVRAPGAGPLISDQPLRASLAKRLARVPGVAAAYPMRFALVGQERHVAVLAMPIVAAARRGDLLTRDVPPGDARTVAALARGEVVVSRLLARRRGVGVGDRIRLPVAHGGGTFRIAGLFDDINADDSLYMDLKVFSAAMGDREADRFAIVPEAGARVDDVAARMRRFVAARRIGATVASGAELTDGVVDTVRGLFSFARLALIAAALVAALTITNTMLTTTLERRRELAVQRMLGMRAGGIAGSVVLEGAALAAIAALIGIGVGLLLGFVLVQLVEGQVGWHVGVHVDLGSLLVVLVVAPLLGAVAAGYPGWSATRPELVTALKDE